MKLYQKIMAISIIPLYVTDYLVTMYFINIKKFGIEAEGNPILVFFWNHIGQLATFFLFLILLILGISAVIKWWNDVSKTFRIITTIAIVLGILLRVAAITGWILIGG